MVRWVRGMTALLACVSAGVVAAPSASAADVYSYANGCYALRDATSGRYVARDEASYRYLVESIRKFPDQPSFATLMKGAGLEQVRYRNLSGGIAAIHSGWCL